MSKPAPIGQSLAQIGWSLIAIFAWGMRAACVVATVVGLGFVGHDLIFEVTPTTGTYAMLTLLSLALVPVFNWLGPRCMERALDVPIAATRVRRKLTPRPPRRAPKPKPPTPLYYREP